MTTPARSNTKRTDRTASTPARGVQPPRNAGRPRARRYRYNETSSPAGRMPSDDRTIKRSVQVELLRPAWNGTLPTTVRPFPMFCAEDPTRFDPTRLSTDAYDLSDWIRSMPAAKYIGVDQKFTFLLWDPVDVTNGLYDPNVNPYVVLYRAIRDAVDEGEAILGRRRLNISKWAPLVSDRSKKKAFSSVTKLMYVQGLVYQHREDIYVKDGQPPKGAREGDLPQIVQGSKTANDEIANMMNETVDGYNGSTDDHEAYYQYGEPIDFEHGKFLTLYNPEKHTVDMDLGPDDGGDPEEEVAEEEASQQSSRQFKGWKARFDDEFLYINKSRRRKCGADITKYADAINRNLMWWDDILYVPPTEEICLWLASAFRSLPTMLEYAWADHPEFFTNEVRGVLATRTVGAGAEVPSDDDDEDNDEIEDELDEEEEEEVKPAPNARQSAALPAVEEDLANFDENELDELDSYDDEDDEEVSDSEDEVEEEDAAEEAAEDEVEEVDSFDDELAELNGELDELLDEHEEEAKSAAEERAKARPGAKRAAPKKK